jgi:CRP-like cAMP-binding protein
VGHFKVESGIVNSFDPTVVSRFRSRTDTQPRKIVRPRFRPETSPLPERDISANKLIGTLGLETQRRVGRMLKKIDLSRDRYLCQQGERVEHVYFPETAVVSEFHILEDGRTIEVNLVGSEAAVGTASLFGPAAAINCTQVTLAGTAYRIERDVLLNAISVDKTLRDHFQRALYQQIRDLSQKVICNSFHSVEQRLCTWLLMLHDRCRRPRLDVTQEQIARVLGVHRPSVTCIAQSLRNKSLIDYMRGRIYVRDPRGLEDAACICYQEFRPPHQAELQRD